MARTQGSYTLEVQLSNPVHPSAAPLEWTIGTYSGAPSAMVDAPASVGGFLVRRLVMPAAM